MQSLVNDPLTVDDVEAKFRAVEDARNARDATGITDVCAPDADWRDGVEFCTGRVEIEECLTRQWARQNDGRVIMEIWARASDRVALRSVLEYQDRIGQWKRAYSNELWAIDGNGLIRLRIVTGDEHAIAESDRRLLWPLGPRPRDYPGLVDLRL